MAVAHVRKEQAGAGGVARTTTARRPLRPAAAGRAQFRPPALTCSWVPLVIMREAPAGGERAHARGGGRECVADGKKTRSRLAGLPHFFLRFLFFNHRDRRERCVPSPSSPSWPSWPCRRRLSQTPRRSWTACTTSVSVDWKAMFPMAMGTPSGRDAPGARARSRCDQPAHTFFTPSAWGRHSTL